MRYIEVPEPRKTGWLVECGGVTYRTLFWEGACLFLTFQDGGEEHPFASIPYEDARFAWAPAIIVAARGGKSTCASEGKAPGPTKSPSW